jgi:hypothetical protein
MDTLTNKMEEGRRMLDEQGGIRGVVSKGIERGKSVANMGMDRISEKVQEGRDRFNEAVDAGKMEFESRRNREMSGL